MKHILLTILICALGWTGRTQAALSVDAQVRLLAGFPPLGPEPAATAIAGTFSWQQASHFSSFASDFNHQGVLYNPGNKGSMPNVFSIHNLQLMTQFFAQNLEPARSDSHSILDLFGGADVLYPILIFPNMERLVVVGLEKPGSLPDVEQLAAKGKLDEKMNDIRAAYNDLLTMTYFITLDMAKSFKEFGVAPIMAVGLLATGNRILAIESISLDSRGGIQTPRVAGRVPGVRIRFEKPNHAQGEVIFIQQNLNNTEVTTDHPEFLLFLHNTPFDTAYYKAAAYVSESDDISVMNQFVLDHVRHLVQSDDGLPFKLLADPKNAPQWSVRLFGIYTPPAAIFRANYVQPLLREAYGEKICAANAVEDMKLFAKIWGRPCQVTGHNFGFASLTWDGTLPFSYGYSAIIGPRVSLGPQVKWSNLLVADKH